MINASEMTEYVSLVQELYCEEGDNNRFSHMQDIVLHYENKFDKDAKIRVVVDCENHKIEVYYKDNMVAQECYDSLDSMLEDVYLYLSFEDLVTVSDFKVDII